MTGRSRGERPITEHRKAFHDYHIIDTFEAGIVLTGTEVKAIREGRVNLRDSYGRVEAGEVFVYNIHITFISYDDYVGGTFLWEKTYNWIMRWIESIRCNRELRNLQRKY